MRSSSWHWACPQFACSCIIYGRSPTIEPGAWVVGAFYCGCLPWLVGSMIDSCAMLGPPWDSHTFTDSGTFSSFWRLTLEWSFSHISMWRTIIPMKHPRFDIGRLILLSWECLMWSWKAFATWREPRNHTTCESTDIVEHTLTVSTTWRFDFIVCFVYTKSCLEPHTLSIYQRCPQFSSMMEHSSDLAIIGHTYASNWIERFCFNPCTFNCK